MQAAGSSYDVDENEIEEGDIDKLVSTVKDEIIQVFLYLKRSSGKYVLSACQISVASMSSCPTPLPKKML